MDKVSIIIATFNASATLQKCLDSIFGQQYPNIEIVVVDGKSTDDTVKILTSNTEKIGFWISEKDNGVYDAMNKALRYITGKWVYFIGADDELTAGFSEMLWELKDPNNIYYGSVLADGSKRLGKLTKYQFSKFGPYHQAIIYPKTVFDKYEYETEYKISADFVLTLKLCGDNKFRFVYLDHIIAIFNSHGLSGKHIDVKFQNDKAGLILKNFGIGSWFRYKLHRLKNMDNPRA